MSTAIQRIAVFRDTENWIKSDKDLSAAVAWAKQKTAIFYEDDYPMYDSRNVKDTEITISGDRSFQAAMRLKKDQPDSRIAVMNFANAFHPGGGVTRGASAQEESLCRCSTLYPLLKRRYLEEHFYGYHKKAGNSKATDTLVYMKDVVICKTDEDLPKRMPKEDWVTVDVITIAAPDLSSGMTMSAPELFGYHVKRAIHLLTVAASEGADTLVLGAFGCGAFANNPEVVANAYKTALSVFPKVFKRVEFAIYRPKGGSVNYDTFQRVFAGE